MAWIAITGKEGHQQQTKQAKNFHFVSKSIMIYRKTSKTNPVGLISRRSPSPKEVSLFNF